MKLKLLYFSAIALCLLSSCSRRLGDLTIISNRNVNLKENHVQIKRDISASDNQVITLFGLLRFGKANLEGALDEIVEDEGTGEYISNAKIYVHKYWFLLFSIEGYKLEGDLMGTESQKKEYDENTKNNKKASQN